MLGDKTPLSDDIKKLMAEIEDGTRENTLYQRADALLKDAVTNTAAAE